VKLYQFLGKDNITFHTVIFPSTLLATGQNWTLLHHVSVITREENSARVRDVVCLETMRLKPEFLLMCGDIICFLSVRKHQIRILVAKNNTELLNVIGNLCHRVLSLVKTKYKSVVPCGESIDSDREYIEKIQNLTDTYIKLFEKVKIKDALRTVLNIASLGNALIQQQEPFKLIKNQETKNRGDKIVSLLVHTIRWVAVLLSPFVPDISNKIFNQLNIRISETELKVFNFDTNILNGHTIGIPVVLVRRIENDEVQHLREYYSGEQVCGK